MTTTASKAAGAATRGAAPNHSRASDRHRFRRRRAAPEAVPPDVKRHYAELARQSARACGLQRAQIITLDHLIAFTNRLDWAEGGTPGVYRSNARLSADTGIPESTLRRHMADLEAAGLISRPGGKAGGTPCKRYGHRSADGRLISAASRVISLAPLRDREAHWRRMIADHAAEADNRRTMHGRRAALVRRIDAAIAAMPPDAEARAEAVSALDAIGRQAHWRTGAAQMAADCSALDDIATAAEAVSPNLGGSGAPNLGGAYNNNGRNTYLAARARDDRKACLGGKASRERMARRKATAPARPAAQAAMAERTTAPPEAQTTALAGTPDLFQSAGVADIFQPPPAADAGAEMLAAAEAACPAAMDGLASPAFSRDAARARSPSGLADLAGMTIGASRDAVGECIRRHGLRGATSRYLVALEKSLFTEGDSRRVERPGGYFRALSRVPDAGIAATIRSLTNAQAVAA